MKVLIDGKEVVCNNDVKVIFDTGEYLDEGDLGEGMQDVEVEPHLTVNHEGVIVDNIKEGQVFTTSWRTIQELVEECH